MEMFNTKITYMKWSKNSFNLMLILVVSSSLLITSCKDDDDGPAIAGPSVPLLTSPTNEAIDQPLNPTLSWNASKAPAGVKEYAVFFDTNEDPQTLLFKGETTEVTLSTSLSFLTKYFWKVQVTDNNDQIAISDVFSFTTQEETGFEIADAGFGKALQAQSLAIENGGVYALDEVAAALVTTLDLGGSSGTPLDIKDLDGIQFFTSLVTLDIDYTSISDLDLSSITSLDTLQYTNSADSTANFLTNLSLPSGMKRIRIFRHNLADFDASQFPELTYLKLDGDDIPNAAVGGVTNVLVTVDVDKSINTTLVHLDMGGNLDAGGNPITYEVSQASFAQLTSEATGNKDGVIGAFEGDAGFEIPDIEFGKALAAQGLATEDGGVYSLDETAAALVTTLDLGGSSGTSLDIRNIDGIEFFSALVTLDIDYTSIANLDVSSNTNLDTLQYTNSSGNTENFLTTMDLPSGMKRIRIFRHNLSDFDATEFSELEYLRLDGNGIPNAAVNAVTNVLATLTIDENINTSLIHLDMGANLDADGNSITYGVSQTLFDQLTSDATGNKDGLVVAFVGETGFEIPDVEFGKALAAQGLAAEDGGIYSLDETGAALVTTLDLGGSSSIPLDIKDLDGIQFFTSLVTLDIDYTSISDLDLSGNTSLDTLQYTNSADNTANFLTIMDLPSGMKRIRIFRHNLSDFDATAFIELEYLKLDGNDIPNAAVNGTTNVLTTLTVDESINASLIHLDMGGNLDSSGDPITYEVSQALFDQLTSASTGNKDDVVLPPMFSANSVDPVDGASDIATSSNIVVTFSSNIDESSLVYTFKEGSTDIPHSKSVVGTILTLTPNSNLNNSTSHNLEITAASGTNGGSLATNFTSVFTTVAAGSIAVVSVEISSKTLTIGTTPGQFDRSGTIDLTFTSSVENKFGSVNYELTSGGSPVASSFTASGSTIMITPSVVLSPLTDYKLTLLSADPIADNDGSLVSDEVYDFATAFFGGGDGSVGFPFEISSAVQLDSVRKHLAAIFNMTTNVDLASYISGLPNGWDPILDFTGSFDGNGNEISNLEISLAIDVVGLFGLTTDADISNVGVSIGAGGVVGNEKIGGLIGSMNGGTVSGCYVIGTGTVSSTTADGAAGIGGLIGEVLASSTITRSYSTVNVDGGSAGDRIGGLIGYSTDGSDAIIITQSFATGNVTGDGDVGGLIGQATDGTISDCYATGDVTGAADVGGLVGDIKSAVTNGVSNSYASGAVSSSGDGGFVLGEASSGPSFSNLYYDNSQSQAITTNGSDGTPVGVDFGIDGSNSASFGGFSGSVWSFGTTGISGSNGPVLQWE